MKQLAYISVILHLTVFFPAKIFSQSSVTFSVSVLHATCKGGQDGAAAITANGNAKPLFFNWSNGQTLYQATGLGAGTYTVHITDSSAVDTAFSVLIVEKECEPSGILLFTPNGDGVNDTWEIKNLRYWPGYLLLVYNRWGQLIHEQEGIVKEWDGTSGGKPVPDATYFYILYKNKNDKSEGIVKGSVTITR